MFPLSLSAFAGEGGRVIGRIVDESGAPVSKIEVTLVSQKGRARAESSEDGTFAFDGVSGQVYVTFKEKRVSGTPFRALIPARGEHFLFVEKNETKDLGGLAYRKAGFDLEGKAVLSSGSPAGSCRILVTGPDGGVLGAGSVTKEGRFSMSVRNGHGGIPFYTVRAYEKGTGRLSVFEVQGWTPWEKSSFDVRIPEDRGILEGRVESGGKPVAQAALYLYLESQKSLRTHFPVGKTDAEGRFRMKDLPRGSYEIRVVAEGLPRSAFAVKCPCEGETLKVEVVPTGAIEGYVELKIQGKPVQGITEEDAELGLRNGLFLCDEKGDLVRPLVPVAFAKWAGDGWSFKVPAIAEGSHHFQLRCCEPSRPVSELLSKPIDQPFTGEFCLHESFRVVRDSTAKRMSMDLVTSVKAGETSKIEVRKDLSVKEAMEFMNEADE